MENYLEETAYENETPEQEENVTKLDANIRCKRAMAEELLENGLTMESIMRVLNIREPDLPAVCYGNDIKEVHS